MTSRTSAIGVDIASDKSLTNALLSSAGLPVPKSRVVSTEGGAVDAAKEIGYPVVVKPLDGNHGRGVGLDLKDEDDKVVCTIRPRADYVGKDGLSYEVKKDGATFSITATYDSTKEAGTQSPVTLLTLGDLADPVAYLVTVGPPPRGSALPADSSAQLSGGAEGLAAGGLLYT